MNTIDFYNKNAKEYFEKTLNIDMSIHYNAFLKRIPVSGYILDFGCGSGRDSKYFLEKGYMVKSIDGSKELSLLASSYLGQNVICMDFNDLNELNVYDGIWACASILHVPRIELINIFKKMSNALKINGIMYVSFKDGKYEEKINGKYYNNLTKEMFYEIISNIKELNIIEYYSNSSPNINETKSWNNFILQKQK